MIRVSWVPGILIVHTHRSILTKPSAPCLYGFRGLPCTSYHRVTCEGPYQRIDCDAQKNSRQRRSALASGKTKMGAGIGLWRSTPAQTSGLE